MDALIGYTGFVGSNINNTLKFDRYYNSKNIEEICGLNFDRVICTGVRAEKWWANLNPKDDQIAIERLFNSLIKIKAKQFILISTIDVYPNPLGVDEDTEIQIHTLHPYGKNRLWLELEVRKIFQNVYVIRLPALFGNGLKKNALFDLINDNQVDKLNMFSIYQWYFINNIVSDLIKILEAQIPLINLVSQPLALSNIVEKYFPEKKINGNLTTAHKYDVRSKFANHHPFLGTEGYMKTQDQVISEIGNWIYHDFQK